MPQPVPIVFCITDLEPGGAERALVELVTRLPRNRFSAKVVSLAPRPIDASSSLRSRTVLVERLNDAGIETRFLDARSPTQSIRVVFQLKALLQRWKPTILQTFLFHANFAGAVAARMAGTPHTVAGIRVSERRRNVHGWLTRRTASYVDVHVCVSESVARFSREATRLPDDRLVVIPNGIDVERIQSIDPVDLSAEGLGRRRWIVSVGRLDRQKRVDWLLRRAPELLARLPEHDLLIVGDGSQRGRLEELSSQLGIRDHVHFLGWRSDVAEILASSDLLVLTSQWEGMPNVVLESMASSKPVVVTETDGVRQLLGPDASCQIVGSENAPAFTESVVRIATDSRLASTLGEQNYQRTAGCFRIEDTVAAYERLYTSLLERDR